MWTEFSDYENVCRKCKRTKDKYNVRWLDGKIALDAEQVKPHDRDGNAKPNFWGNPLAEKSAQNRDENDVASGEESCLPGGTSEEKSRLLQVHRKEKCNSAEHSCLPKFTLVFPVLGAPWIFTKLV